MAEKEISFGPPELSVGDLEELRMEAAQKNKPSITTFRAVRNNH